MPDCATLVGDSSTHTRTISRAPGGRNNSPFTRMPLPVFRNVYPREVWVRKSILPASGSLMGTAVRSSKARGICGAEVVPAGVGAFGPRGRIPLVFGLSEELRSSEIKAPLSLADPQVSRLPGVLPYREAELIRGFLYEASGEAVSCHATSFIQLTGLYFCGCLTSQGLASLAHAERRYRSVKYLTSILLIINQ